MTNLLKPGARGETDPQKTEH